MERGEEIKQLNPQDQEIYSSFASRLDELRHWELAQLKESVKSRIKEADYCKEEWQLHYSVEAVTKALQRKILYGNLSREQLDFIESWSWAAFIGAPIWAVGSKMAFWALGFFVPVFNIFACFYLGKNGKRLSYQKGWKSFDAFRKRQTTLGWIVFILIGFAVVGQLLVAVYASN